jgi:putative membrane protein
MMSRGAGTAAAAAAVMPAAAFGHDLQAAYPTPGWSWEAGITVPLALSGLLFLAGWRRLYARSRHGRAHLRRRATWFAAGWLVLAGALVSPLHQAGGRSFAAHMFEHELLMLLAAPLLVLSHPLAIYLWSLPARVRPAIGGLSSTAPLRLVWDALTHPVVATLLQAAVLWGWHAPALFDLALTNEAWHAAQHISFLVTALFFWTAMLRGASAGTGGDRGAAGQAGLAALCLFATSLVSGALGALMALSQGPWYQAYSALGMAPFGLTPTEDQQVAGLLMWIPGGLVHAIAALIIVTSLLRPTANAEGNQ